MAPYRPPGRSNRSGRSQADNDVFEGLPVKQWGQQIARVSLAPPASEEEQKANDKWGDPPMPRDYQLLQPWTQQLLRLARSGKVGTKRKPDPDSMDEDGADEEKTTEVAKANLEDRGYVAKKWKIVPEALLEPEHKHFEFLAKRRKGLPSLYGPEINNGAIVPMRKTKVQKAGPDGEVNVYEVLVPEGQHVEGEVAESTELADVKTVAAVPGTVIEGVGIANEEGVVVAEHLKPAISTRRNRPPPKKKGGPGRGKKRVTFTNPDGTTYTKIVPNATKIVPEPGQTVKHVSKGEEAAADVTAEQAAKVPASDEQEGGAEGEGEGEGDEEGEEGEDDGDEGDDDDDREEGELSDDDAPEAGTSTPAPAMAKHSEQAEITSDAVETKEPAKSSPTPAAAPLLEPPATAVDRDPSSSPELPLAKTSHSRQSSTVVTSVTLQDEEMAVPPPLADGEPIEVTEESKEAGDETEVERFDDGDEDLLGNLEKHLEGDAAE
ncbi:hypothetical protein LTR78_005810 [Recurvomyces mirabilis]|uniref:Uncharacterized protein n=1 Tax=Recurvomyces mirabilis TaxID=574656 RepID=A0AAE0WMF4_9PEZI|nr:hypothetical protein LTR78_005810 [Recurvomyces mirabilis]KAK5154190.1 hypothetical protein LTS14_006875 [Recurvomyces mirabilis]